MSLLTFKTSFFFLAFFLLFSHYNATDSSLDYWTQLKENPLSVVDLTPPKSSSLLQDGVTKELVEEETMVNVKDSMREKIQAFAETSRPISTNSVHRDHARFFFVGQKYKTNINQIPVTGEVKTRPWSSSYWPYYLGILSWRYQPGPHSSTRTNYRESVRAYTQPAEHKKVSQTNPSGLSNYISQNYSPAEKYDILLGDVTFSLTRQNKNKPSGFQDASGKVATWMGICDGWAAAAINTPKPEKQVTLTAADGKTKVTFDPDDIRALASLNFASKRYSTIFVGGRCNKVLGNIAKDKDTGLVLDPACFDVNPATWTMILGNQVGINKKSFVFDATWDYEVWNQPVQKYSLKFFNLITDQKSDANTAMITKAKLTSSQNQSPIFKFLLKKASPKTAYFLGVISLVTYVSETMPKRGQSLPDKLVDVSYIYVLELDGNKNIIGGEWLINKHPDFIWNPKIKGFPYSTEDNQAGKKTSGTPAALKKLGSVARRASAKGIPLSAVIDLLVTRSKK